MYDLQQYFLDYTNEHKLTPTNQNGVTKFRKNVFDLIYMIHLYHSILNK